MPPAGIYPADMRSLYIHGFASSPSSRKADAFREALLARALHLEVPEMDQQDFEHLTITGQLAFLESALAGQPACLIGSSMGGYLAALYASLHPEIDRLVLLAPAFEFAPRWLRKIEQAHPDSVKPSSFEVYHYGEKRMRRVHFELVEDALRFPSAPDFAQPALIFHGIHDNVVPVGNSRKFASAHPNARLLELDSDHELLNVLDHIVDKSMAFLR
jgi:pimeloyl-ACP methyl ester carboxylesterase